MATRLTKAEEEVMLVLWRLREAIVRDVISNLKDPETPYTTVSTVIRILEKKGFVSHRAVGTTHIYYPLVTKSDYLKGFLSRIVNNYFNGSSSGLVSFFAKENDLSLADLKSAIEEFENESQGEQRDE